MHVRYTERVFESHSILIRHKPKISEAARLDRAGERIKLVPPADEQKNYVRIVFDYLRGAEHGFIFVSPSKISRIAEDEFTFEVPFVPQSVSRMGDGADLLIVSPIRNEMNMLRLGPAPGHDSGHPLTNHDIESSCFQASIAQMENPAQER